MLGAAVDVARHSVRRHRHSFQRFGSEALLERLLEGGDPEHAVRACADDSNVNLGGARLDRSMPASSLARPPQRFVRAGKLVVERNKLGVESAGKPKIAGVVQ
jgi:hypothetical protein